VSLCENAGHFRLPERLAWQRPQRASLADVAAINKVLYWVYCSKANCARSSGLGSANALEALSAEVSGDRQLRSKPSAQLPTPWVTNATPTTAKMAARTFRR
jgi:hypothetical protein